MDKESLTTAAQTNDRKRILTALRDKLAATIESTESGRDVAALSKRLMEVCKELDDLQPVKPTGSGKLAEMQARAKRRNG